MKLDFNTEVLKYSPDFVKDILGRYQEGLEGKVRNPIQGKFVLDAMDRIFGKVTQVIDQKTENTGTVYIIKDGSEFVSTPQGTTGSPEGQSSI
jgi:hypothetical protein